MHILDLVQNALAADAQRIEVDVKCSDNRLTLRVSDDGRGMSPALIAAVETGFFSTKAPGAVGLGIPLLKETAEECDGSFAITSAPGCGTTITVTFRRDHPDMPPFGDLAATFLDLLVMCDGKRLHISYHCDGRALDISTDRIRELLGGVQITHPEVIKFLQDYLSEKLRGTDDEA